MRSLAELILAADDLRREPVESPEWPGTEGLLFVRQFSGAERLAIVERLAEAQENFAENRNLLAEVVAAALCDEAGNRIFTSDQVAALARKNGERLEAIHMAALKLNGLTKEEKEEIGKKSESTPKSNSFTSSASTASEEPRTPTNSGEG